jgi:hypothetical protein
MIGCPPPSAARKANETNPNPATERSPEAKEKKSNPMPQPFFNVQTVDPKTGDEHWVTVQAESPDAARTAAGTFGSVVGEVRPADDRINQHAQADEDFDPVPIAAPTEHHASKKCGVCGAPMGNDSRVCGLCAYDDRKGIQTSTLVKSVSEDGRRIVQCKSCGYDLSGLPTATCPECGTNNIKKHDLLEGVELETELAALRKPFIAMAVGFGGSLLVAALAWQMPGVVAVLQLHALILPVALVVVSACLIAWIGVDSTWGLTLLQITGAVAVTGLVVTTLSTAGAFFPFSGGPLLIPPLIVGFFILVGSLSMLLEMEASDAAICAAAVTVLGIGELVLVYVVWA